MTNQSPLQLSIQTERGDLERNILQAYRAIVDDPSLIDSGRYGRVVIDTMDVPILNLSGEEPDSLFRSYASILHSLTTNALAKSKYKWRWYIMKMVVWEEPYLSIVDTLEPAGT
jgi:hypothetical protein